MKLPQFVVDILSKKFTSPEVKVIADNWHTYSQMSLTNSSEFEFLIQGKSILICMQHNH